MRRLLISIASIGFFVLAIVGWLSGVPPLVCGLRALAGAAIIYIMGMFVAKVAFRIMIQAAIKPEKDETSDRKGQQ